VTYSVVSYASTGELHEHLCAPHGFGNEQWLATFRAIADQLAGGVH
jgi:hypothetical protein